MLPSTVGVLNNQFKGEHLRRAISYLMISTVGGIGLAGVIGGLIASNFGWQTNFIISIVIAFIAILLLKGTPEESHIATVIHSITRYVDFRCYDW